MKRIISAFTAVLITVTLWSQSPEMISYQAVIRNSSDQLVTNTQVGMRISILQFSIDGTPVYLETQTPSTNTNGLVSIEIGTGTTNDDFSGMDWANGPYFIKTETDLTGGTNYSITATSQLLSVPYALYANEAGNVFSGDFNELINAPDMGEFAKLDMNNQNLSNLGTPVEAYDAATKLYVDELEYKLKNNGVIKFEDGDTVSVMDYDNTRCSAVKIGEQWWMAENLRTSHYNDGTPISHVSDTQQWSDLTTGAYCWLYNDSISYEVEYGKFYNWYAINSNKLCPAGWHVPTDEEWIELELYLGMEPGIASSWGLRGTVGDQLKETDTLHWKSPNEYATNSAGFSARAVGYRGHQGGFGEINQAAYFWTATEYSAELAYQRFLVWNAAYIGRDPITMDSGYKGTGQSVRCLKDSL